MESLAVYKTCLLSCTVSSSGLQYRHSRHMLMAPDSKGARNSLGLGWLISLTATTMELSNRLTNANNIG